jgi:hypothetical protein
MVRQPRLGSTRTTSAKKTDVTEHPQVFRHIGLLFNEPPSTARLLFIKSSEKLSRAWQSFKTDYRCTTHLTRCIIGRDQSNAMASAANRTHFVSYETKSQTEMILLRRRD